MPSLFEQARDGDMEAFTALFEPLRGKIHAVAYRIAGPDLAEDVVMETYLQAWKALPKLKRPGALSSWLCRIARNKALDMLRRGSRTVTLESRDDEGHTHQRDVPDESSRPDEASMRHDDLDAMRRAMQQLSELHRTVLQLRHVDELSYAEIASACGVSIGTVMSRLFNARRKLQAAFKQESGFDPISGVC